MEGKTGRTKGKENTCRTVGITKALADSGHSTARKGFFYFFALKFGYSIETKNPNASPIRKVFGLFVCGRDDRSRTCLGQFPNGPMKAISAKNSFFRPFPLGKPRSLALLYPLFPSAPKR